MSAPFRTPALVDLPEVARTLHLRRQLVVAVDHATALLPALGLPRLVTPDVVLFDPVAIGDALDAAIAALDAIDGDADREDEGEAEPSFGWDARPSQIHLWNGCIQSDLELDTADYEPSLASPERHPSPPVVDWGGPYTARGGDDGQLRWAEGAQHDREAVTEDGPHDDDELDDDGLFRAEGDFADDEPCLGASAGNGDQRQWAQGSVMSNDPEADTADAEDTAPERAGRGFVRCGPDDAEDDDPAERDDDHGCESEPAPWRFDPASIEFVVRVSHA